MSTASKQIQRGSSVIYRWSFFRLHCGTYSHQTVTSTTLRISVSAAVFLQEHVKPISNGIDGARLHRLRRVTFAAADAKPLPLFGARRNKHLVPARSPYPYAQRQWSTSLQPRTRPLRRYIPADGHAPRVHSPPAKRGPRRLETMRTAAAAVTAAREWRQALPIAACIR